VWPEMTNETTAGDNARMARDELPTEKHDAIVLGWGETRIPEDDAVLLTDGGHHPDHTPSTNAPDWNEVKSSSFADGGVTRFPELVGFDRDILLILARSAPCNGRELLADLETLRNDDIGDAALYPHLNALVDAGLVEKRENYHDNRSHEFRLADDGRHSLREHAQRVQGAVEAFEEADT